MDTLALLTEHEHKHSAIGFWLSRHTSADQDGVLHPQKSGIAHVNTRPNDKDAPLPRSLATLVALDAHTSLGVLFMGDGTGTLAWTEDGSPLCDTVQEERAAPRHAPPRTRLVCSPTPFRLLGMHAVEAVRAVSHHHTSYRPHGYRHSLRFAIPGPQRLHPRIVVTARAQAMLWNPDDGRDARAHVHDDSSHPLATWWARLGQDARALFAHPSTHARVANLPHTGLPKPAWKALATPQLRLKNDVDPVKDAARIFQAWPQAACGADRVGVDKIVCGIAVFAHGEARLFPLGLLRQSDDQRMPLHPQETTAFLDILDIPGGLDGIVWMEGWTEWEGHTYRPHMRPYHLTVIEAPVLGGHQVMAAAARQAAYA